MNLSTIAIDIVYKYLYLYSIARHKLTVDKKIFSFCKEDIHIYMTNRSCLTIVLQRELRLDLLHTGVTSRVQT